MENKDIKKLVDYMYKKKFYKTKEDTLNGLYSDLYVKYELKKSNLLRVHSFMSWELLEQTINGLKLLRDCNTEVKKRLEKLQKK